MTFLRENDPDLLHSPPSDAKYRAWYCQPGAYLPAGRSLPARYRLEIWQPKRFHLFPNGMVSVCPISALLGWRLHEWLTVPVLPYRIYAVYAGDEVVHYSVVQPRSPRFPFLMDNEVEIGPVWTAQEHRRKGLQGVTLDRIVHDLEYLIQGLWWICVVDNVPSNTAVERRGFRAVASATRTARFGSQLLGKFNLLPLPVPGHNELSASARIGAGQ